LLLGLFLHLILGQGAHAVSPCVSGALVGRSCRAWMWDGGLAG
jgi:hypothetical protein